MGYDSDAVLMNKAIYKFIGHTGKYSQRKGSLKKIRYQEKKEKRRKHLRSMCCDKNSSSASCGHGAGIACMKEETKKIKGKEKKIQKKKKIPLGDCGL